MPKRTKKQLQMERKLRDFLNTVEPTFAALLVGVWNSQASALTYEELEGALIMRGWDKAKDIDDFYVFDDVFKMWQEDYAVFVHEQIYPLWIAAGVAAVAAKRKDGVPVYFNPMSDASRKWIQSQGGNMIQYLSDEMRQAVRDLLEMATEGDMTADQFGRRLRPVIGLNGPQTKANFSFYQRWKKKFEDEGMSADAADKKATDKANKYAEKQHRQRAQTIAQTEMMAAYNNGALNAVQEGVDYGLLGRMVKTWYTAVDEDVCPICSAMHNKSVDIDEPFHLPNGLTVMSPPAHPRCRCDMLYEEIEEPTFFNDRINTKDGRD